VTPAPTLQQLIDGVRADAASSDPLELLATASATVAAMTDTGDAVLGHFVDQCRRAGKSWTEISASLGVTKQAAHKRFFVDLTFDRFTPRSKVALDEGAKAAQRLGHGYVGTEHVLIGLLIDPDALSTKVLAPMGVTKEVVEAAIVAESPAGPPRIDEPPLTPLARDAVARSVREALTLGHNYVGTEHILLALIDDEMGLANKILAAKGVTAEAARAKVIELLAGIVAAKTAQATGRATAQTTAKGTATTKKKG
jgi:hypothetical protein